MKRQIRVGVFETNSSSTHSLTICSQSDFDKWVNDELVYSDESLKTRQEILDSLLANKWFMEGCERSGEVTLDNVFEIAEEYESYDYKSYDYYGDDELEYFEDRFTTESGDKIVAFGEFGRDGWYVR